jgi:hypothetical protein
MLLELIFASLMNAVNLALLIGGRRTRRKILISTQVVLGGGCRNDIVGELKRRLARIMRRGNATVVFSAELGAFDAGADELPAPPLWARDTCPAFFKDEFWKGKSDCSSGFWLGQCSDPPRLQYANTGVFGGRVADLLRMTQTALTSPRTSGRTDQGKFTTYFTRGLAGDSRLTLDYCAELVTNAFRLTPSARRRDAPDSLLADGSKACLAHYNGPSKHFWRTRLT